MNDVRYFLSQSTTVAVMFHILAKSERAEINERKVCMTENQENDSILIGQNQLHKCLHTNANTSSRR